jgi:hypothetical protein
MIPLVAPEKGGAAWVLMPAGVDAGWLFLRGFQCILNRLSLCGAGPEGTPVR